MKRMEFLLFMMIACMSALPLSAQDDVRLTIAFNNDPLPAALLKLEKRSSYKFLFTYDDLAGYTVTGKLRNSKMKDIIDYVLRNKPFSYSVEGKFVNIRKNGGSKLHATTPSKTLAVNGQVVDQAGETVIGAQVRVVGSQTLTVTDADGNFAFADPLPEHAHLQFSYVGMKTMTVPARRNMKVKMEPATQELGNVVVTGIFRKAKESYTGSVSTITSEQLDMYKGQNLLQTLKNADVSLNFAIDNLNGSNPNNLPNINIRGNSSLPISVSEYNEQNKSNPNTPLVILDGFEISLSKLMDYNDEEIQSVNILKDAAATAIYGSRGANGVIVVVTKKPEAGKLKISAEVGVQMEIPDLSSYHLLDARGKLYAEQLAGLYDRTATMQDDLDLQYAEAYYTRLRKVLSGVNTDWLSKPLHNGVGSKYNLRVEGGSNEFRWAANANYNQVEGAMKGSSRRTFNGSVTLMYDLGKVVFQNYTSVGLNTAYASKYGAFSTYASQQPYNAPYDENGNLVRYFEPFYPNGYKTQNPLYDASLNTFDKTGYQTLVNNFSIEWKILDELTLRGKLGISKTDNTSDYFLPAEHSYFTTGAGRQEYGTDEGFLRRGLYKYGSGKEVSYNANVTLSYSKTLNDVHSVYGGVDWSLQESKSDLFAIAVEGFTNQDLHSIADARQYANNMLPSGSNDHYRQFGVTANANYTYDNRYYVDLSYRMDGNSRYGSNKKYAPFYSGGIGWNIHREKFMGRNGLFSTLRLKLSYGVTGSATGASATDAYSVYKYVTNNKYMNWTGAQLTGWGNPDLTWQTTHEFNGGVEFGLLEGRMKGSFEVYTKNTDDLLSVMNTPASMGFTSYYANVGKVRNTGFEAMLSGYVIRDQKRGLNWMLTGQLTYNKNKITHLSDAIKRQTEAFMSDGSKADIQSLFFEGKPQNAIYAVRSYGIDPSTGKEIYLDKNGNITRKWSASDKVYLGSAVPLYRGTASSMVRWKNWTFNVSFYYYWGGKTYNSTLRDKVEVTTSTLTTSNVDARVLTDRWHNVGDVVFFKAMSNNTTRATSRYVMDDNVLELQSVSLQYKLKSSYLQKLAHVDTIILGVNASDLLHWGSIRMERGTSYPY